MESVSGTAGLHSDGVLGIDILQHASIICFAQLWACRPTLHEHRTHPWHLRNGAAMHSSGSGMKLLFVVQLRSL